MICLCVYAEHTFLHMYVHTEYPYWAGICMHRMHIYAAYIWFHGQQDEIVATHAGMLCLLQVQCSQISIWQP